MAPDGGHGCGCRTGAGTLRLLAGPERQRRRGRVASVAASTTTRTTATASSRSSAPSAVTRRRTSRRRSRRSRRSPGSTSSTPRTPTSPPRSRPASRPGDTPDIGFFPQPGGLLELAADGKIQPIDTYLDYDTLDVTLVPGLLDVGPAERPGLRRPDADGRSRASSGTRRRPGTQPGYTGAADHPGARPTLAAQIKQRPGITPVVHGLGRPTRRPAGSAPTGSSSTCSR